MLWILTVEHNIRQQVHRLGEVVLRDGGIEHGVLLVSKGVQLPAHTLQGVDHLQGIAVLSAFEGHVLTEMRQSFLSRLLVTSPSRYLIATIHHL